MPTWTVARKLIFFSLVRFFLLSTIPGIFRQTIIGWKWWTVNTRLPCLSIMTYTNYRWVYICHNEIQIYITLIMSQLNIATFFKRTTTSDSVDQPNTKRARLNQSSTDTDTQSDESSTQAVWIKLQKENINMLMHKLKASLSINTMKLYIHFSQNLRIYEDVFRNVKKQDTWHKPSFKKQQ